LTGIKILLSKKTFFLPSCLTKGRGMDRRLTFSIFVTTPPLSPLTLKKNAFRSKGPKGAGVAQTWKKLRRKKKSASQKHSLPRRDHPGKAQA
jgi:hypothetical protein